MFINSLPDIRSFRILNGIISVCALSFLAWLLLRHRGNVAGAADLAFMPAVNASFNALSAVLLLIGRWAISQKKVDLHRRLMMSAFASSGLFLLGYVAYHWVHGDTKYVGPYRGAYLALLASHVLLSMVIVPMAMSAFYFAFQRDFQRHTRVTRVLWPIWMYVSVTGVALFFVLH